MSQAAEVLHAKPEQDAASVTRAPCRSAGWVALLLLDKGESPPLRVYCSVCGVKMHKPAGGK